MTLPSVKIGEFTLKYPIIQGGMGVGISWDRLASNVSLNGCLGVISSVGTGYYQSQAFVRKKAFGRPKSVRNFYSKDALFQIFANARKVCKDFPLGVNVLYAINDYGRVVRDACQAGANIVITGAGLPVNMPEFTKDFPKVALVPIVSSARALKIICKKWSIKYKRLPDAVILEGPKSGGHQGFTYEQCFQEEYQLENIIPSVVREAKQWNNEMPIFAAGGIWDHNDIAKVMNLGVSGVQMATRFIGTYECDAAYNFKKILIDAKEEDIQLFGSPVGYPARGVKTNLKKMIEEKVAPKINCVSNCVAPCNRGEEARAVGYCIADRLADAWSGNVETGLFFSGSNGYRMKQLLHVKDLIKKLIYGENTV